MLKQKTKPQLRLTNRMRIVASALVTLFVVGLSVFVFNMFINIKHTHGVTVTSIAAGNWNAGTTWSTGAVPATTDDVTINNTVNVNLTTSCNSLTVGNAGTLNFNTASRTLTVTGNMIQSGTITATAANNNRVLTVNGLFTVPAGRTCAVPGIQINLNGGVTLDGTLSMTNAGAGITKTFSNLTINGTGVFNFTTATTVGITGNVIMQNGAQINGTNTGVINIGGTLTVQAGLANIDRMTVTVTGKTYVDGTMSFGSTAGNKTFNDDVIVSSTGDIDFQVAEVMTLSGANTDLLLDACSIDGPSTGTITVGGRMVVNTGQIVDVGRATITVNGKTQIDGRINFNRTNGTKTFNNDVTINGIWNSAVAEDYILADSLINNGTFTSGNGIYEFTGVNSAILGTSDISFYDMTNNKTANTNYTKLGRDITVTHNLTMTSGDIDLAGNDILLSTTGTVVAETNANRIFGSFGDGYIEALNRPMNASTTYTNIAGIGFSITTSTTAPGTTTIRRGYNQQTGRDGNQSIYRYYDFIPTTDANLRASIQLNYFVSEIPVGYTEATMQLWNADAPYSLWFWEWKGFSINTTNHCANVSHTDSLTSRWTLGDFDKPLPIELLSFTGKQDNNTIILEWKTASETNNDYFVLQRSYDNKEWYDIHQENGQGNSNTLTNYNYTDVDIFENVVFYKLKQVDFDGKESTYGPIYINRNNDDKQNVNIYFYMENLNINMMNFENESYVDIYDVVGKKLLSKTFYSNGLQSIDMPFLIAILSLEWQ